MVEDGATQMDGDLPVNMSGGVLSSNPIGASGMLRFAEAAMQVRGQAGEHQFDPEEQVRIVKVAAHEEHAGKDESHQDEHIRDRDTAP